MISPTAGKEVRKSGENKENRFPTNSNFSIGPSEELNQQNQKRKQREIVLDARPGFFLTTPTLRLRLVRKKPGLSLVECNGEGGLWGTMGR